MAGVDWILAENWWPYQRPTFVTPPFAGYVSGHSTFSRAAAEVMTMMTGDAYFPGGMGEFFAEKNKFLVFEEGPSQNVTLQWATYRDASDQCSLSRIWGGIHPPADDMPGRLLGIEVGTEAFNLAKTYWENGVPDVVGLSTSVDMITDSLAGAANFDIAVSYDLRMDTTINPSISFPVEKSSNTLHLDSALSGWEDEFTYKAVYNVADSNQTLLDIDIQVSGGQDVNTAMPPAFNTADHFDIDMENPHVVQLSVQPLLMADQHTGTAKATITATFNEVLDTAFIPQIAFPVEDPLQKSLSLNTDSTGWVDSVSYRFSYNLVDSNETLMDIDVQVTGLRDTNSNASDSTIWVDQFSIDTENPYLTGITASVDTIKRAQIGTAGFSLSLNYSENMDTTMLPNLSFPVEDPTAITLTYNPGSSYWMNPATFMAFYDVDSAVHSMNDIDVEGGMGQDKAGNPDTALLLADHFHINIVSDVSLAEFSWADKIELYPNPVRSGQHISLSISGLEKDLSLQLFDMQGRRVYSGQLKSAAVVVKDISTTNLPVGAYLLNLQNQELQLNRKLIIIP
ncbi:MAG: T9SS type A sorting domain-containing protein [Owenweeksia sp.]|nr:T9SS type A sorting domain-containing protein [Owenweeksia sp.]